MRHAPPRRAAAPALALLLVALPLAGCVAPAQDPVGAAPPEAVPGGTSPGLLPAARPSATGLPAARVTADAEQEDNRTRTCTLGPERTEDRQRGRFVLLVEGCTDLLEPLLFGDRGEALRVDFAVPPGTAHLMVQVHFHGPERLVARLDDRDRGHRWVAEDWNGTESRDSVVRWEVPQPAPGPWRVRGFLDGLVVARTWTVAVVAEPAA